ncbi:MAG: sulfite exporter TauE/SafE family protein [Bacillota bacterium]|nr:sulfite exporter TauE/SafE family protein [Bacillota bacterium]
MSTVVSLIVIVTISSFIQGLTGFGLGIFLMCFLPMVLGYQSSVVICLACGVILGIIMLFKFRHYIELKKILPFLIVGLVVQFFGTNFLFTLSDGVLKVILGVVMLLFAVLFFLAERNLHIKATPGNTVLSGCVAGFCGSLGVGGPPVGYFCHSLFQDNLSYMANIQVCLIVGSGCLLIQHFLTGGINTAIVYDCAIASIVCIGVLFPTMKLFSKLNRSGLTKLISSFLLVMGVVNIVI